MRKKIWQHVIIMFITGLLLAGGALADDRTLVTPSEAYKMLKEGNQRFLHGRFDNFKKMEPHRKEVAKGQKPFAIIVSCSDSRVPPEVVFDQGLGDLFVIRLFGNLVDAMAMGSIEYAVDHLGVPLILVLCHKRCAAVQATLEVVEKKQKVSGNLPALVNAIKPAVVKAKGKGEDRLHAAIRNNAQNVNDKIEVNPVISKAIKASKLVIVKGYYDLDTGKVNFWTKED
jgi:carbonic anhydrase